MLKTFKPIAAVIGMLASINTSLAQERQLSDFRLTGVDLQRSTYRGVPAFLLTMPRAAWQDPRREKPIDRNFMAWLPIDFHDGVIEVDVASDLAPGAPEFARGFVGLSFRIDDAGRFESIYLRPTNSVSDDQVRRNHSVQTAYNMPPIQTIASTGSGQKLRRDMKPMRISTPVAGSI